MPEPRVVIVTRPTELERLLARHGTRGQAEFFLASRGQALGPLEERQRSFEAARAQVLRAIPVRWRRAQVKAIVCGSDGEAFSIGVGVNGHPLLAKGFEATENPEGDFSPVGQEHAANHGAALHAENAIVPSFLAVRAAVRAHGKGEAEHVAGFRRVDDAVIP